MFSNLFELIGGWKIKLAIAIIIALMISSGIFYIRYLREGWNSSILIAKSLQKTIDDQTLIISQNKLDIQKMKSINIEISESLKKSQQSFLDSNRKFSNIIIDLKKNPTSKNIEHDINKMMNDSNRCNELVTGSDLTHEEISGDVKNSICQDLIDDIKNKK